MASVTEEEAPVAPVLDRKQRLQALREARNKRQKLDKGIHDDVPNIISSLDHQKVNAVVRNSSSGGDDDNDDDTTGEEDKQEMMEEEVSLTLQELIDPDQPLQLGLNPQNAQLDLKRDVETKLMKLQKRTRRAIVEILRQKMKRQI